jgi:transposase
VVARLKTIPGIGPVAAATLFATIGDIGRFRNARMLAAYAGLVPSVRQSGDSNQVGRITKEGSRPLRAVLVQCAHVVTRSSNDASAPLRAYFDRIRGTRGRRKIALVALARHLLRIAFHVWKDATPYRIGGLPTA